jgi:hypothetical protein
MNLRIANGGSDRSILALLLLLINVPILTAVTSQNDIRWHLHSWHASAFKFCGTSATIGADSRQWMRRIELGSSSAK